MTDFDGNHHMQLSRRRLLLLATAATGCGVLAATNGAHTARAATTAAVTFSQTAAVPGSTQSDAPDFQELDAMIQGAMARYHVPGVAVGVIDGERDHSNGYGITNVDVPVPVDANTLFQTGSITKTYTATLVMRLVEMGKLELDAPVRRYLPDLELADASVAVQVTVRQLLNHSSGWFGDYFGPPPTTLAPTVPPWRGDDAITRYVANLRYLPQLAPLGAMFNYNNAAVVLAGHLVEAVTNTTYEAALTEFLLDPLGMDRAYLFPEQAISSAVAAGHQPGADGLPAVNPSWLLPRALNPTGGLVLSMTDQLTYARFHLGDGTAADGTRLLQAESLAEMRTARAPGLTISIVKAERIQDDHHRPLHTTAAPVLAPPAAGALLNHGIYRPVSS